MKLNLNIASDLILSLQNKIFPHTGPKVPHSRPTPKRKHGIFGLNLRKNIIRSTGVKLARVAIYTRHGRSNFFLPRCVIYYYNTHLGGKTWTVHILCKLPSARVANTRWGLANFTCVERILFFLTSRLKITYFRFGAGRE